jgi:hypothetical protein
MIIPFMEKLHNKAPLRTALLRLLRPIVNLLIKNEVSHSEFSEFAKQSYVFVAHNDFAIPNRKKTFSRVAVLTGLSRKEVVRLLKGEDSTLSPPKIHVNRAARVVTGWLNDADFLDPAGNPRRLPLRPGLSSEPGPTFSELVERYSGDITSRAILDELLRLKIASIEDKQYIRLQKSGYIPDTDNTESIDILFNCAGNLLKTGVFNITDTTGRGKRFQRQLTHFDIPQSIAEEFKTYSQMRSQALLLELDKWLATKNSSKAQDTEDKVSSIGVGIYYFEEQDHEG